MDRAYDKINNIQLLSDILALLIIERSDLAWSSHFSKEISRMIINDLVTHALPEN